MDISALQEFYRGFYITTPQGNNAFSYDARLHKKIYVPPLIKGSIEDVQEGGEIVFCDLDFPPPHQRGEGQGGGLQERQCKGLKHFVHIERPGQNIFIFDNHNHAFSFWAAGVDQGVLPQGATLVHVDQHKDTREPEELFRRGDPLGRPNGNPLGRPNDAHEACHYANYILNVGNFIPPAVQLGWFKDVVQVNQFGDTHLIQQELSVCPRIIDIDLDIFAPIMSHIPDELIISCLREWISRAPFVTIATSPFFMDQAKAMTLIRKIVVYE
jgi:hypothetical protein